MEKDTTPTDATSDYVPGTTEDLHHHGNDSLHSTDDLMRGAALAAWQCTVTVRAGAVRASSTGTTTHTRTQSRDSRTRA